MDSNITNDNNVLSKNNNNDININNDIIKLVTWQPRVEVWPEMPKLKTILETDWPRLKSELEKYFWDVYGLTEKDLCNFQTNWESELNSSVFQDLQESITEENLNIISQNNEQSCARIAWRNLEDEGARHKVRKIMGVIDQIQNMHKCTDEFESFSEMIQKLRHFHTMIDDCKPSCTDIIAALLFHGASSLHETVNSRITDLKNEEEDLNPGRLFVELNDLAPIIDQSRQREFERKEDELSNNFYNNSRRKLRVRPKKKPMYRIMEIPRKFHKK